MVGWNVDFDVKMTFKNSGRLSLGSFLSLRTLIVFLMRESSTIRVNETDGFFFSDHCWFLLIETSSEGKSSKMYCLSNFRRAIMAWAKESSNLSNFSMWRSVAWKIVLTHRRGAPKESKLNLPSVIIKKAILFFSCI